MAMMDNPEDSKAEDWVTEKRVVDSELKKTEEFTSTSRWEAETRATAQMPKLPACYHRGAEPMAFGPGDETHGWPTTTSAMR